MAGGQPTKYKPEYCEQAEEICEKKGYTDKGLAAHFKVSVATIYNWKKGYLEFLEAVKRGKDAFDTRVVESRLLKRALGYRYKETTKVLSETPDPETGEPRMIVSKEVTKEVVPDVQAIWRWLCCRMPERWQEKHQVILSFDWRTLTKDGSDGEANQS